VQAVGGWVVGCGVRFCCSEMNFVFACKLAMAATSAQRWPAGPSGHAGGGGRRRGAPTLCTARRAAVGWCAELAPPYELLARGRLALTGTSCVPCLAPAAFYARGKVPPCRGCARGTHGVKHRTVSSAPRHPRGVPGGGPAGPADHGTAVTRGDRRSSPLAPKRPAVDSSAVSAPRPE
jgi:hypothetical protein